MKDLKIYFALLVTFLNINFALSQFTPPTTYFETSHVLLDILNPSASPGSGVFSYFDLSKINTDKPDIAISENMQQLISGITYQFTKYGNWNSNLGSGNFSLQNHASPFFPQESFIGEPQLDINKFTAANFIKLRNTDKKDFVALRRSNLYVFQNESGTLSNAVQNISTGGTYMDVGNFTSGDNNDDVGIVNLSGVIKIYRNDLTGMLTILEPSPNAPANKFKIKQINDKTFPYPQINPDDRDDIVTITNNPSKINIYFNNNNNTVTQQPSIDIDFVINDLEVADINRDGYNDVTVLGNLGVQTVVKVFLNNGSGIINNTPVFTKTFFTTVNPLVAASDINNDGYNDLVIVLNEGYTFVFINTRSGSYFSQTADQTIPNLIGLQSTNSQIKVMDIYNQGGKALFIGWSGNGPVGTFAWGVSRVNAVCFNWPPPPPVITASTYQDGTFIRPRILIHSNSTIGDFSYNRIYKANPVTGWNYVYIGATTGTQFIDYSEYILWVEGFGEAPPPNCYYKVKAVDQTNYLSDYSDAVGYYVGAPTCPTCGVEDNNSSINSSETLIEKPTQYKLSNFPNPFNPSTKIYYVVPKGGNVKVIIYNSLGQIIKELVNEFKNNGSYVVEFDGSELSSGIYYYRLEAEDFVQTKRMILIK